MLSNYEFKYTQSTLSKFDIIGSYFVNLYYNEFYTKAHTLRINGTYENVTEAYKNILSSYLDYTKKPEFFKQIVKGIHAYCISTTKYTTMTHKECVDFMINEFIPQKLWNSIRENQKNKLFHESINNSIALFTTDIISNHLVMIIDNHSHSENITILQDLFLKIILLEKDKVYSKFLNPDSNNVISTELFKSKLLELVNDKKEALAQNSQLKKNVDVLKQLLEKNSKIITELQKKNKELNKNLNDIKIQLDETNKKNIELNILLSNINKHDVINKEINKSEIHNQEIKKNNIKSITINKKNIIKQDTSKNNIIEKSKNKKENYSKLLLDSDNDSNEDSDNDSDNYVKDDNIVQNNDIINDNKDNTDLEFDTNDDYYE